MQQWEVLSQEYFVLSRDLGLSKSNFVELGQKARREEMYNVIFNGAVAKTTVYLSILLVFTQGP